ncbi:MAG: hypothetical protein ACXVR1_16795, partial [Solirubrobacteraceae bacterium]
VVTAVMAGLVAIPGRAHLPDTAAVAAAAALAFVLATRGSAGTVPAILLAPLGALAGGVLAVRGASLMLVAAERAARRSPVAVRAALVGLAREPSLPSLWVAFVAVAVGLGGFALCYRATLERSASDQAAAAVPLDAIVSPGPSFTTPLQLASLNRWKAIARGGAWPVRRTEASLVEGAASVTVPALGVPVAALARMHGWRASDGPAPLGVLAHRIAPTGPVRTAGPAVPPAATRLALRASVDAIDAAVTADLSDAAGAIHQVLLGDAGGHRSVLRGRLPGHRRGAWELTALELDEPTGLQATNGHQNGENEAAATQAAGTVTLGDVAFLNGQGAAISTSALSAWRAVGAAGAARAVGAAGAGRRGGRGAVRVHFADTGEPGIVRPPQPSDAHPVPVLADAATAAGAGRGDVLALTVDGEPVTARVAGVLRRFPTVPAGSAGFVVADERTLAAALDAQLPGQGRPDELWIASRRLAPLRAALRRVDLVGLQARYRRRLERELRDAPVARAVLGTLVAAAAMSAALAIVGLLSALLGAARDRRTESDLTDQGAGPRAVRGQLRLEAMIASALGVVGGAALALALASLTVVTVRAVATLASGAPPLVTVDPAGELVLWSAAGLVALALATWLATAGGARGAPW